MAEQTLVSSQGMGVPPDILAQVQHMKPAGFTLQMLPPTDSASDLTSAKAAPNTPPSGSHAGSRGGVLE